MSRTSQRERPIHQGHSRKYDYSEEESYVSVEDEDVLNKVFEIFKERFKDDFDFVD